MRKIIVLLLTVALLAALSVPAFAVTPKWEYKPIKLPQIKPDIGFVQSAIAKWLIENPIDLPDIKITFTSPTLN